MTTKHQFIHGERVSFTFPERFHSLIVDADFHLNLSPSTPSRVGLIGPNGHGKTTLLRLLLGQLSPDTGSITRPSSRVAFGYLPQAIIEASATQSLRDFIGAPLAPIIALGEALTTLEETLGVAQNDALDAALERYGVLQERYEAQGGYTLDTRVESVMRGLGLESIPGDALLETLSMGQRTRAALARILLTPADLLILDEPTNHLDRDAIEWLEAFLCGLDAAFVVASHDRAFLDNVVDEVWSLECGRLETYPGNYSAYRRFCEARAERLEHEAGVLKREIRRLEGALTQRATWSNRRERDKFGTHCMDRGFVGARAARHMKRSKTIEGRIQRSIEAKRSALPKRARWAHMKFETTSCPERVLSLRDIGKTRRGHTLFEGIDFDLRRGQRLAVVGPNGCGKSTLLQIIAGQLEHDHGRRWIAPQVRLHHFTQDHRELCNDPDARVIDVIADRVTDAPGAMTQARVLLGCLGLPKSDALRSLSQLSEGQRSRVALVVALLSGAHLLLLDEPTNHLDPQAREALERGLTDFQGAVVFASHDRRFIEQMNGGVLALRSTA